MVRTRLRTLSGRLALIGGVSIGMLACESSGAAPRSAANASEGGDHPLVGAVAPSFDLEAQSGAGQAALAEHRGKVVIVDFWATWCEPCRVSFPKYQALSDKFGDGLVVIGISEDEDPEGIAAFARDTGVSFPLAWDEDKSVAQSYDPKTMPTSYIIDKNGLVRFVHPGFRRGDEATIEGYVQSLM